MSRFRYVKGNITEITGGKHRVYSKDVIENISAKKVIQNGKEGGVSYGIPDAFPTTTSTFNLVKISPNIILKKNNILAVLEVLEGDKIKETDTVKIMGINIDFWIHEDKLYFIPPNSLVAVNVFINSIPYIIENRGLKSDSTINEATTSISKQMEILHEAIDHKYSLGGKSSNYRKDRITMEGYYRLEKALDYLESKYKLLEELNYIAEWNKNII